MLSPAQQHLLLCLISGQVIADAIVTGWTAPPRRPSGPWKPPLWRATLAALLAYALVGDWSHWIIPCLLWLAHLSIELLVNGLTRYFGSARALLAARASTFGALLGLAVLVSRLDPPLLRWVDWLGRPYLQALVLLSGLLLTVYFGGHLVGLAVGPLLEELRSIRQETATTIRPEERGFARGGKLIGQLERALIFLFVLQHYPAGVGFLVAAKSIFRFGELKEHRYRMEAEYIIIGTLLSFSWAMVIAHATRHLFLRL